MDLIVTADGTGRAIYDEIIALEKLGALTITRASHVEAMSDGRWKADLSPVGGPILGPFFRRSEALAAEHAWLEHYWLRPLIPVSRCPRRKETI